MSRLPLLFILLLATSLWAREEQFLIEDIVFEGVTQQSESLLASTLLLVKGVSYSEEDIRQGAYRLQQLQFIRQVDMRLERGSQRGAYRLIVHISEAHRFFYVLYSDITYIENDLFQYLDGGDTGGELDRASVDPETGISGVTAGYRWFPDKYGDIALFGPVNPGISYTHHNLFHRNVVASLALQYPGGFGKNFSSFPEQGVLTRVKSRDSFGVTFLIGTQITPNQRLGFNYKLNAGTISETQPLFQPVVQHKGTNFRNHKAELVWTYDTKDHPLFPTSGRYYKMGVFLDREFRDASNDDPNLPYDALEANNYYSYVSAQRFWNYRSDRTFAVSFLARSGKIDLSAVSDPDFTVPHTYDSHKFEVDLLLARNLLDVSFLGMTRDFRLEAELSYDANKTTLSDEIFPGGDLFYRGSARLSLVSRDDFGLIRMSLVYRTDNEELWQ